MFDPLSALSCIGFAIGVVGLLATTLSKVDEDVDKIRECRDLLLHFHLQLKDGQLQLRAWRSIWMSEPQYEDELYIYFWGRDGFDDVRVRLHSLLNLSTRIRTIIRRPIGNNNRECLLPNERLEWHYLLGQENFETDIRTESGCQKVNLLRRIGFSLFGNAALQDKIGRFKSQVQGLDDFSTRTFRLLRSGDPNSKVSLKDVRELAALKQFIDQASMLGSSAFEHSRSIERTDIALEISPPEEDQALRMWNEMDDLHLDLFIRSNAFAWVEAGRFRIICEVEAQNSWDEILELLEKARSLLDGVTIETNPTSGMLLTELERPRSWSRPFRKMLLNGILTGEVRKSFDVECADLIFGLAYWFIQFWNTPWAVDLCSCNIRQVRLLESKTRHSLTAVPAALTSHSECRPVEMADHKLMLLGKTLAEAALGVPISLNLEGGEVKFILGRVKKTRGGLLTDLTNKYGRRTITRAIKYCLDPAHANHKDFLPESMEPFCQNILQPLARFHTIIVEHCKSKYGAITRHQEVVSKFYDEDSARPLWHDRAE